MIVCPGCHQPAPDNTWPTISMGWAAEGPELAPWWCPACLAARIAAAHAGHCACIGCGR